MNEKPLDLTKPVQTRDGRPYRILATDAKNTCPVIGLVTGKDGVETIQAYPLDGRLNEFGETRHDLVNVPQKRGGWVNLYPVISPRLIEVDGVYATKEEADRKSWHCRIACVRIEWEE